MFQRINHVTTPALYHRAPARLVLVATGLDGAADVTSTLLSKGFAVRRCGSESDILDAVADSRLGCGARPGLLLIGSGLYQNIRTRLSSVIRDLGWSLHVVVQQHEAHPMPTSMRASELVVDTAASPAQIVRLAARHHANAQLRSMCQADQRAWRSSRQRIDTSRVVSS